MMKLRKCRVAWGETINYLCIDRTKNKIEGKFRIFSESKNTYIECIPETASFQKIYNSYPHNYSDMYNYTYKCRFLFLFFFE